MSANLVSSIENIKVNSLKQMVWSQHLPTMSRRFRPIIGLLLCNFLLGNSSSRKSDWQVLALGMDFRYVAAIHPSTTGKSRIAVLRIDPKLWELEAIGIGQTGEQIGHTAKEWCNRHQFAAAINAGMFAGDGKTHLGYSRYLDQVNNSKINRYQSVAAFNPRNAKLESFHIFDLDTSTVTMQSILKDYASAVQNLRLVKRSGLNQWSQQNNKWSEAALGEDSAGRILFIFSRTPFSMHDLNQELLASDIGLVAAQHLEGGPEAQLYVHAGGEEMELYGSFETSFRENDSNAIAWPVPNVLGVRPRAEHGR